MSGTSSSVDYDYEDGGGNTTDAEYEALIADVLWPNLVERWFVAVLVAMMVVGVVGNSLVVLVVFSNKSMRNALNIVLTNLALADLLILLFCLPPTVINDVTKTFWFSTVFCKSVLFIQNTSVYVSVLSLVFITCERWRAITYPLKPPFFSTSHVIPAIWLLGMMLSSPEPLTLQLQPAQFLRPNFATTWGTQCKETWSQSFQRKYQLVQALCAYLCPLFIISCLCIHMSRTLKLSRVSMGRRHISSRKKAVRMLCAVVFLFALSNLPVHVYNIALSFDLLSSGGDEQEIDVNMVAIRKLAPRVFSYSSSCLNPILYSFMSVNERNFTSGFNIYTYIHVEEMRNVV
ncbi:unnamed protein product [Caenorhabditis auriculariae]|uniref:G-protein coupled receptors family 1 profile domain-containing protein n=1 Tax=Caenorhabditis auriculariae TaxID=2777116 RepID=A0A8S1GN72_9PELO|nr:unnamed protein product [Caenorhabditis auriculariae]